MVSKMALASPTKGAKMSILQFVNPLPFCSSKVR